MARTMPKTARNTPSVQLSRAPQDYQLHRLENPKIWTESELRAEYSRLRAVANKRIDRLLKSEFADAEAVQQNVGKFVTLSSIGSTHELAAKLNEVKRFLSAKSSTVTGQKEIREKTIEGLRHANIDISESDYVTFGKFMEWARRNDGEQFDSDQAADIFTTARVLGVSPNIVASNFQVFKDNYEKLIKEDLEIPGKTGKKTTGAQIFEALGVKEQAKRNVNLNTWYKRNAKKGTWAKKQPRKRRKK